MKDSLKDWLESRDEIASRLCTIPDEDEIFRATTGKICSPESSFSKVFLPEIVRHAGRELNAGEITQMLIDSYNKTLEGGEMDKPDCTILGVTLDLSAEAIVPDKEVCEMVKLKLNEAIEFSWRQRNDQ